MIRVAKLIVLVIVALVALSFASLNAEGSVMVNYYLGEREVPLIILMLAVLTLGMVLGFILMLGPYLSATHHCRIERRQHLRLQKQQQNQSAMRLSQSR